MIMFKKLATPDTKWITLIFFLIITPLAAFISDHALAAMFLPIRHAAVSKQPDGRSAGKTRNWPKC